MNLEVDRFRNGDLIPQAKSAEEWSRAGQAQQPAWCYYGNKSSRGNKYGKLYKWYAVNDSRGLAPIGWHIPTEAEWMELERELNKFSVNDTTNGWYDDIHFSSSFNFIGQPGGIRHNNGSFHLFRRNGYWWSSTEGNSLNAWCICLFNRNGLIPRKYYYKEGGLSVRCVKD